MSSLSAPGGARSFCGVTRCGLRAGVVKTGPLRIIAALDSLPTGRGARFDEITLPTGPFDGKKSQFAKTQRLEDKITRIRYASPKDRSSLEIVRSYQ